MSYNSWTFQKTVKWLDLSPPRFGKNVILILIDIVFFMKELTRGAILSQNHWRTQGGDQGDPGPLNQNATQ